MKDLSRNIPLLAITRASFAAIFAIPVLNLYWASKGMNLFDVFLLQGIFSVCVLLFEVPSGFLADVLGRRKTLIVASLFKIGGWIVYFFAQDLAGFIAAELVLGVAFSMISGTDSSMLYETLQSMGRGEEYTRREGRQNAIKYSMDAMAAIATGFLLLLMPINGLFLLSACSGVVALSASLLTREPSRTSYSHPKGALYGLYKIGRFVFLKSRLVRLAAPLMAGCLTTTMLGVWMYQPLWQERGMPVWLFGLLWAGMTLPAIAGSWLAGRLTALVGKKAVLWLIPLPALVGYLVCMLAPGQLALLGVYLVPLTRGLTHPILSAIIHEETWSDKRATVMSMSNLLFRLEYFVSGALVGAVGTAAGLSWAFAAAIGASLLFALPFLAALARERSRENPVTAQ